MQKANNCQSNRSGARLAFGLGRALVTEIIAFILGIVPAIAVGSMRHSSGAPPTTTENVISFIFAILHLPTGLLLWAIEYFTAMPLILLAPLTQIAFLWWFYDRRWQAR